MMNGNTLALAILVATACSACAGTAGRAPAMEPTRCMASETLVCYGKTATKLGSRLGEADYCHCEQRVNLP